jgi:hypothetical protein
MTLGRFTRECKDVRTLFGYSGEIVAVGCVVGRDQVMRELQGPRHISFSTVKLLYSSSNENRLTS